MHRTGTDPKAQIVEVINVHAEAVIFTSNHPSKFLHPKAWNTVRIEPGHRVTLPHQYYSARFECGWADGNGGVNMVVVLPGSVGQGLLGERFQRRSARRAGEHKCLPAQRP